MGDIDIDADLGRITRLGDQYRATLERTLDHPRKVVWAMLIDPDRVAAWLAPGTIDPRPGGKAQLDFADSGIVIDSAVSACVPERLLEYSWSGPGEPLRPLRWQLEDTRAGTRLKLILTVPANEDIARTCAGWEAHLTMLQAAIEGVPIKFPFARFQATRALYDRMLS